MPEPYTVIDVDHDQPSGPRLDTGGNSSFQEAANALRFKAQALVCTTYSSNRSYICANCLRGGGRDAHAYRHTHDSAHGHGHAYAHDHAYGHTNATTAYANTTTTTGA